jgi:S1-C subfamily serine protease
MGVSLQVRYFNLNEDVKSRVFYLVPQELKRTIFPGCDLRSMAMKNLTRPTRFSRWLPDRSEDVHVRARRYTVDSNLEGRSNFQQKKKNRRKKMSAAQTSNGSLLTDISDAMAEAVARAGSSTVLVSARRRFPASGIVYATDLVLTADHVIEREDDITVKTPDGVEISATLVGRDPGTDLALLRLSRSVASIAQPAATEARVGQFVLAVGRPTSEGIQASLGVVSSIGGPLRTGRGGLLERYLATDAVPYPGFSGGPLVDAAGQVVGVNTSGLARGTSLAIPASLAWQTAAALAKNGRVRRGYLGIRSQPVELPASSRKALGREQASGLLLVGIEDHSPASDAGLMIGDILVGMAGQSVSDPDELLSRLSGSQVGSALAVEILRGGQLTTITVTVGERK